MAVINAAFRFIHAADLHLDSPFRGLAKAPDPVRTDLADATFLALKQLTDTAIAEKVDFIVIAGDLFDEADRSLRAQLAMIREWERLAAEGIAVFAIHGNHDHLGGRRAKLKLPSTVHLFGAERVTSMPAYSRTGDLVAYIYGISYGERAESRNLAAAYCTVPGAPYHIGLLHANVGGNPAHDPYAPCTIEDLIGTGIHYWALGHIHKREMLHEYPHIAYAGNIQGRNPRELGAKGCYIVDVSGTGKTDVRFAALDVVRWIEKTVSIEGISTEQELLLLLEKQAAGAAAEEQGRSVMLRLRLQGRGELHALVSQPATLAALLEQLQMGERPETGTRWVYVYELTATTGIPLEWDVLRGEDSFAGELLRLSEVLQRDEAAWQKFAKDALGEMFGHARLRRIGQAKLDKLPDEWLVKARELTLGLIAREEDNRRRS